jgi:hypothetical protein
MPQEKLKGKEEKIDWVGSWGLRNNKHGNKFFGFSF